MYASGRDIKSIDDFEFIKFIKNGMYLDVSFILKSLSFPKAFLEKKFISYHINNDHDQNNSLTEELREEAPALVFAAKFGHTKLVSLFLKEYNVEVNQDGCIAFDGYLTEGATALWCASGAGHFDVVKVLVENKALLNKTTKTSSTPLRAASFDGRLDIVKYLVDHGADCNIPNIYKNTCLMIASYRGHFSVVEFLLQQNIDPNCQAQCGATALLFAAEAGHQQIARLLMEFGAQFIVNKHGADPLFMAAEFGRITVLNYFIYEQNFIHIPREKIIHAMELMGAHLINDKECRDLASGFTLLTQAMRLRIIFQVPKNILHPVQAYGNHVESNSQDELDNIRYNVEALEMEALIIRERILGASYIDLTGPIIFQGAIYADQGRFNRTLDLWLYALELKRNRDSPVYKDLLRHAQLLAQMITVNYPVEFHVIYRLLDCAGDELDREVRRHPAVDNAAGFVIRDSDSWSIAIHNVVYFTLLACEVAMTDEEEKQFRCLLYAIMKRDYRLLCGSSMLHMAVNSNTKADYFHLVNQAHFPSAALVKLMCQCGADTMSRDLQGNTPLHLLSSYDTRYGILPLHSIVGNLLHYGSHPDAGNLFKVSAYHLLLPESREVDLYRLHFGLRRLECLALEVAMAHNKIPPLLSEHVEVDGDAIKLKLGCCWQTVPEPIVRLILQHRPLPESFKRNCISLENSEASL